ncbi:transmembrane protein 170A [Strongylocentrotus purpuratus]|uniref:Transmembrane protein 170A n=1 Tax=Strongylocentrotus purpuratus TaxID=7668 RepID=A0A7M7FZS0_STRPU|nr:transmembrane protein 170A [Strongylocentrotus purpuratus]|eukprot:XP_001178443.1 PREDICTED: transmembrane protein 170A [Strongylocentrotus purpuratus]
MAAQFPSFQSVISLKSNPLDDWIEMWYQIFLWYLFSSFLIHSLAAITAFCALRKHKIGRLYSLLVILMGLLGPITGGIASSAIIAGLFYTANISMYPLWALVCGTGQTFIVALVSFSRILGTL